MNRRALEHIVRAAAAVANEREIVVIGSQAILGQFPDAPADLLVRIQNENTGGAVGLCLEVHDLAIAKLVAGRPRDVEFVRVLVRERMVDAALLHRRLDGVKGHEDRVAAARSRLARLTSPLEP